MSDAVLLEATHHLQRIIESLERAGRRDLVDQLLVVANAILQARKAA